MRPAHDVVRLRLPRFNASMMAMSKAAYADQILTPINTALATALRRVLLNDTHLAVGLHGRDFMASFEFGGDRVASFVQDGWAEQGVTSEFRLANIEPKQDLIPIRIADPRAEAALFRFARDNPNQTNRVALTNAWNGRPNQARVENDQCLAAVNTQPRVLLDDARRTHTSLRFPNATATHVSTSAPFAPSQPRFDSQQYDGLVDPRRNYSPVSFQTVHPRGGPFRMDDDSLIGSISFLMTLNMILRPRH
jgi:hypothetical protein